MKVKFFVNTDAITELESEVNAWLKENPEITVKSTHLASCAAGSNVEEYTSYDIIAVFYEENYRDE